jgi:hypothetical protein
MVIVHQILCHRLLRRVWQGGQPPGRSGERTLGGSDSAGWVGSLLVIVRS